VDFRPFEEVRAAWIFAGRLRRGQHVPGEFAVRAARLWLGSQPCAAAVAVAAV